VEHPEEADGGAAAAAAAAAVGGGAAWDRSEAAGAAAGAGGVGGAKEDGGADGRGGRRAAVGGCEGVLAPEGGGGRPGCVADIVQVSSLAAPRALLRPPRVAAGGRLGGALGRFRFLSRSGCPPLPPSLLLPLPMFLLYTQGGGFRFLSLSGCCTCKVTRRAPRTRWGRSERIWGRRSPRGFSWWGGAGRTRAPPRRNYARWCLRCTARAARAARERRGTSGGRAVRWLIQ
jgi:hypothetical protein